MISLGGMENLPQHLAHAAQRSNLITASVMARLLCKGYAKNEEDRAGQRAQLIREKAGLVEPWAGNETTELATLLEDAVILAARQRFGWDIRPHGRTMIDPQCAHHGATPDATVGMPFASSGFYVCNVKVSGSAAQEDIIPTKKDGSESTAAFLSGCPEYYRIQLQSEICCTGALGGILLVLHHSAQKGLKLRHYMVPRDEEMMATIRREVHVAWFEIEALRSGV